MNKTENILTTALEECAEIQQAISKAMRFGMNAHHPMKPDHTNAHDILTEYYQLQAVMELLQKDGILPFLPENEITAIKQHKLEAMRQYQNISVLNGCLDIRPAVPAKTIENTRDEILQRMDEFLEEWKHISQSSVDHFGSKIDAMETARHLVDAALTDIIPKENIKR